MGKSRKFIGRRFRAHLNPVQVAVLASYTTQVKEIQVTTRDGEVQSIEAPVKVYPGLKEIHTGKISEVLPHTPNFQRGQ